VGRSCAAQDRPNTVCPAHVTPLVAKQIAYQARVSGFGAMGNCVFDVNETGAGHDA
jgi:hypothetical protein